MCCNTSLKGVTVGRLSSCAGCWPPGVSCSCGRTAGVGRATVRLTPWRDLVGLLEGAGLTVRRASYANCLPAVAQEVRGRLFRGSGGPSHPSGGGLQIRVPHPAVNRIMGGVAGAEAWVAGRLGVPLPFGHSTLVLAERDA